MMRRAGSDPSSSAMPVRRRDAVALPDTQHASTKPRARGVRHHDGRTESADDCPAMGVRSFRTSDRFTHAAASRGQRAMGGEESDRRRVADGERASVRCRRSYPDGMDRDVVGDTKGAILSPLSQRSHERGPCGTRPQCSSVATVDCRAALCTRAVMGGEFGAGVSQLRLVGRMVGKVVPRRSPLSRLRSQGATPRPL